jgi:tetratricopeptide (TPR) repeat protein
MASNSSESPRRNNANDRNIKRLQDKIANGDEHLRAELAEALMRSAQEAALEEKFDFCLKRTEEAIKIIRQLVKEGQLELDVFVGRTLLFRAAVTRFHKGPQAGVNAFNEAIHHIADTGSDSDPQIQNELAIALMSKADILIDPLGAYAAALASQEQAAKIWQHLVDQGNPEFRQPLVSALLACSDSKVQNGDAESALRDLKEAAEIAEEAMVDSEDLGIQPLFIQTLIKLSKLYEQEDSIDKAFETLRSAVNTVQKLIEGGIDQARMMYTTLYLHIGMLYEKTRDSASALAEFDRCRDVYTEIFREHDWGTNESYAFRSGLANVLMCRANMLADLKRYAEAEQTFEESVWQYQQAAEHRPQGDTDDTLIPYSIGVVQLNHANLLVIQDKIEEAVALKTQALAALESRMAAGHEEILPNFLTAHRKLINIRQMQGDNVQVLALMDKMVGILEKVVDDGKLEFRLDLGLTYRHRSVQHDEQRNYDASLRDAMRALQTFRMIADDDRDLSDVHVAKVQWSELLHQIAVLKVKVGKSTEAFDFMRREIADVVRFYEEGNDFVAVDLLLCYTQYFNFVETFGNHIEELKYPAEEFAQRLQEARAYCQSGITVSEKRQGETGQNLIAKLFFMMKTAFFHKAIGILYRMSKNEDWASHSFETSIERWHALLAGLENLKAKDRYDAAEKGEPMPDWDIPGGANDPYHDRYIFYINELRETMQLAAKAYFAGERQADAERLFEKENALTRELAHNGIHNADRFLIVSLTSHARSLVKHYPVEKTMQLYDEALQMLEKRFASGDIVGEDFWVLRRVNKDYFDFLWEKYLVDIASRVLENLSSILWSVETFPSPNLWEEVCSVLESHAQYGKTTEEIVDICQRHRKLVKRHPDFKSDKGLKRYDRALKARVDEIRNGEGEETAADYLAGTPVAEPQS